MENLNSEVYKNEPQCALLNGKYFKVININEKEKVTDIFYEHENTVFLVELSKMTTTFKIHLRIRLSF